MAKFEVGDKVKVTQIDKNYGNPYVGKEGHIIKVSDSKRPDLCNYQVIVLDDNDNPVATLTLFDNELDLIKSAA
jgi:hypothetical protein